MWLGQPLLTHIWMDIISKLNNNTISKLNNNSKLNNVELITLAFSDKYQ